MRLRTVGPAGLLVVLLTGCTVSISGHGSEPPRAAGLQCGARAVTIRGAPFCYAVPAGFVDTSASATVVGSDPFKTAVQIEGSSAGRDLVTVSGRRLAADSDLVSDAALSAIVDDATAMGSADIVARTPTAQLTVAGHRADESTVTFKDGVKKRYILAFTAYTRVSIGCQWQQHQAAIATACGEVLKTLRVDGSP